MKPPRANAANLNTLTKGISMLDNHMTLMEPAGKGLIYNGTLIRDKGEMLSLTDMWKAAGSPENSRPADWFALPQSQGFIEAVAASSNAEISGIWKSKRGNNGGTFGHWQIGIAYAKYLSHDFHMWGNQAIREKMEGARQPGLPAEVLEQIERSFGISRMLSHKVTGIESTVQTLATAVAAIATAIRPPGSGLYVQGVTSGEIWAKHDLPKIKNGARWLGNRLTEMGCQIDDCRTARLGTRAARMFDDDRASACMKNGLLHKARVYASERMNGQRRLKLVEAAE